MGRPWCADLPVVTVGRSSVPKERVTLIVPYYEQPQFLTRQLGTWTFFSLTFGSHFGVIVVDDGSPTMPASDVYWKWREKPEGMKVFRIQQDVRWNWLAARNVGAYEAREGWLLLTDMDHMIPPATMEAVMYGTHRVDRVYAFSRQEHTGDNIHPHSASFLMTRRTFWRIGGYDETLSGYYGTDGDYRRRVAQHAKIEILPEHLVRYEYVGDSSTTRYLRKQPEDARVKQLIAQRGPEWKPKVLSFPYTEVAA